MCGIVGGMDRVGRRFGDELAVAACQRIAHRGPDDQGWAEFDGVLIGNRRLSILDLEGGHQPMWSDDGQIAVVQNGEIYNFVELSRDLPCRTQSDTEVILRLYERDGENFVRQLNGMFAIAILDRNREVLFLFRDRVGKKPLYIHDTGDRLLFASEIKSLLAMGVAGELDWQALDAFLTYNYVPPPATIFKGIRHLRPGHYLRVDRHGVQERCWWKLESQVRQQSAPQWEEEILDLLSDAVRIRLRSDVPLGAFLSGGVDSSLIVKLMSDQMTRPVKTFCIGLQDAWFQDQQFAQAAADFCGSDHHCEVVEENLAAFWPLTIYHNDQPHGDISFLPTYRVSNLARQALKVVLTGDGGDELFAGYDLYPQVLGKLNASPTQEEFEQAYFNAISLFSKDEKQCLFAPSVNRRLRDADAFDFARCHWRRFRHMDRVNQLLALDVHLLLPGNNLVKPDKMGMAASLEARAPFMDYRLIELAFQIPGHLKLRNGETKSILKRAAARLLPSEIVYRSKQMFTMPVGRWFRGPLQPFLREVLLSRRARERGLFSADYVCRLIDEHQLGKQDHTRKLRALVVIELWHRIFLDRVSTRVPDYEELGLGKFRWSCPTSRVAA